MDPEIVCYVLRNSPLRLVRVPRISLDVPGAQTRLRFYPPNAQQMSPNAISLEDIPKHYPELSIDRLNDTPDDQLIFFWAEVAQFEVSELIKHTAGAVVNAVRKDRYTHYYRNIMDMNGNAVAQTACCYVGEEEEVTQEYGTVNTEEPETGDGIFEFILIANNSPPDPESKPSKVVLQVLRKRSVMHRVNNAEIPEEVWNRTEVRRMLVALG